MNKTMQAISHAVRTGTKFNASPLYRVKHWRKEGKTIKTEVFYRDSRVFATTAGSADACMLSLCGYPTMTTRKVINAALDGARIVGTVYQKAGKQMFDGANGTVEIDDDGFFFAPR